MNPIHCLIIDDEPLARKGLKEYIGDVDYLQLMGEYDSPVKAEAAIREKHIELLFLDIQMPRLSGLEFLRTLKQPPPVIFTTAFPQHALDGFELNALDYLVKPISFERFLKAAAKAREYYELRSENNAARTRDYFFIKADGKLVKIFYTDILLVEALQNYVAIHTEQKKYICYLTFRSIAEYLPAGEFIRTHKSYIVPIARIDNIEGNEIHIGPHRIPISRTNREEVMAMLLKGRMPGK